MAAPHPAAFAFGQRFVSSSFGRSRTASPRLGARLRQRPWLTNSLHCARWCLFFFSRSPSSARGFLAVHSHEALSFIHSAHFFLSSSTFFPSSLLPRLVFEPHLFHSRADHSSWRRETSQLPIQPFVPHSSSLARFHSFLFPHSALRQQARESAAAGLARLQLAGLCINVNVIFVSQIINTRPSRLQLMLQEIEAVEKSPKKSLFATRVRAVRSSLNPPSIEPAGSQLSIFLNIRCVSP